MTSATKSNGIIHTHALLGRGLRGRSQASTRTSSDQYHIDASARISCSHPDAFDVVVASNLFGDILSDLGRGGAPARIGIAPRANLNPEREHPSMFEPVHGSAPDIAGRGIANPIGQIWSGAMMLEHLGHPEAGAAVDGGDRVGARGGAAHPPTSAARPPLPSSRTPSWRRSPGRRSRPARVAAPPPTSRVCAR